MNFRAPLLTLAVAALGAPLFAQTAAPAAQNAGHAHVLSPSAKLLGLPLRNDSDRNLGEIGDVLVDPRSGEIRYAVLEVGGFLGMGEDQRVIPWAFVQVVPDEKDAEKCHARTNLTESQIKAAPKCKTGQRFDAELDRRIEATFGKDDAWAWTGKDPATFAWLSQIDGVEIKDASGKSLGKLQDVILAPQNGCIAYAIVDTTNEAGDKDVAVPWSELKLNYDRNDQLAATTSLERAKLAAAPEFDDKDWKRMSSTAWMNELSTYYACDPFWKNARFASARKLPAAKADKNEKP